MAAPVFEDANFGAVNFLSKEEHKRQVVSEGDQTREILVDCCSTQTKSTSTSEVGVRLCSRRVVGALILIELA